jgi:putative phage-type endonuclease
MRLVELQQSSPDWLLWRNTGIGSSDAPGIAGRSPFAAPLDVFRQKKGLTPAVEENHHMRRGKELEGPARERYQELTGVKAEPACGVHDDHDFIKASFDGWDPERKLILEIKAPARKDKHELALRGIVPDIYYCQVQHQFLVSGGKLAHFVSTFPKYPTPGLDIAVVPVYPDPAYIAELLALEKTFWRCVVENVEPS